MDIPTTTVMQLCSPSTYRQCSRTRWPIKTLNPSAPTSRIRKADKSAVLAPGKYPLGFSKAFVRARAPPRVARRTRRTTTHTSHSHPRSPPARRFARRDRPDRTTPRLETRRLARRPGRRPVPPLPTSRDRRFTLEHRPRESKSSSQQSASSHLSRPTFPRHRSSSPSARSIKISTNPSAPPVAPRSRAPSPPLARIRSHPDERTLVHRSREDSVRATPPRRETSCD